MSFPPRNIFVRGDPNSVDARFFALLMSLLSLDKSIASGEAVADGFDRAGALLDALPLTSSDFSASAHQLNKARRYHASDELGDAKYELNLLIHRVKCIARFIFCLEHVPRISRERL